MCSGEEAGMRDDRRRCGAVLGALLATVACAMTTTAARAEDYAPLDRPGPALGVPADQLAAALHCTAGVRNAKVAPVLLNPATGVDDEHNYSWNWEPALDKLGIPWCAYTAPYHTLGDIQTSGEYLVFAIRTMYGMAGRRISIMGHSQGGMSMRWALRFWPDTRDMVDDVIGFSGSNHGTTVAGGDCAALGCPPAVWQQAANAKFIAALNSRAETCPRSPRVPSRPRPSPTPRSGPTPTRSSSPPATRPPPAPRCTPAVGGSPTWRSRTSARPMSTSICRSARSTPRPTPWPSTR